MPYFYNALLVSGTKQIEWSCCLHHLREIPKIDSKSQSRSGRAARNSGSTDRFQAGVGSVWIDKSHESSSNSFATITGVNISNARVLPKSNVLKPSGED